MPIITLTTDLGLSDHYAGSLKGSLLSLDPGITLVDISHLISPFNIMEAAYVLRSAYSKFPPGTVHIAAVDHDSGRDTQAIALSFRGHYFVGPDNGLLGLVKEMDECEVVALSVPEGNPSRAFRAQSVFGSAAIKLSQGASLTDIGEPCEMREIFWGHPTLTEDAMRGIILHVDHFGNAITNIRKDEFLRVKGERTFQIFIRTLRLQRIHNTYADVPKGEAAALINDSGHLEIAIREGSASQLLGLKVQDMLTIEFYG